MDITYNTSIRVVVEPVYWKNVPMIAYGCNNIKNKVIKVDDTKILDFSADYTNGEHTIWIDFFNKTNQDCLEDKDMAIKIVNIEIEGMRLYRFKWAAKYIPKYPKDWIADNPNQPEVVPSAEYLGWNGRWQLSFTTPIFTWIHRLENLGWLYEP